MGGLDGAETGSLLDCVDPEGDCIPGGEDGGTSFSAGDCGLVSFEEGEGVVSR